MFRPLFTKKLFAILALVGLTLTGCSALSKRQSPHDYRQPTSTWSISRYDRPSHGN
jgi:hypothetical protein